MPLRLVPGIPAFGQNGQQTTSTRDVVSDTATFGGEQDISMAECYGQNQQQNLLEPRNESTRPPDREWR